MTDEQSTVVKVFFTGLLLLHIDEEEEYCEARIHNRESCHHLTIRVVRKRAGRPDEVLWRHNGPLNDHLWIDVVDDSRSLELYKHGTLDKSNPLPEQDTDIRWAIDLEGIEFHKRPLEIDLEGVRPCIYLTSGLFYTALRTDPKKVKDLRRIGGGEDPLYLYSVASIVGANISLVRPGASVILQFAKQDEPFLALYKPDSNETYTYEVYVENEPILLTQRPYRDFRKYYQVIDDVPPTRRFDLIFGPLPATQDVPCLPSFQGVNPPEEEGQG